MKYTKEQLAEMLHEHELKRSPHCRTESENKWLRDSLDFDRFAVVKNYVSAGPGLRGDIVFVISGVPLWNYAFVVVHDSDGSVHLECVGHERFPKCEHCNELEVRRIGARAKTKTGAVA
jgi:hypothetical protein